MSILNFHYEPSQNASLSHPLIILHGLLGSKSNWRSVQKKLAALGMPSYSVDLRNHGDSFHAAPHDYQVMAQDILDFIRLENLDRPILLGHSMGGKVAMVLGLISPQSLSALLIVDIAPIHYLHGHEAVFAAMKAIDLSLNPSRKSVRESLSAALDDPNMGAFLGQNYHEGEAGTQASWRINLALLAQSQANLVDFPISEDKSCLLKTCVIAGAKSHYITDEGRAKFDQYFPNHQIHSFQDAGHWPHIETPELFLNTITTFLKGV